MKEEKHIQPIPQKYLERIIKIAGEVWRGEKDMMLIAKDTERKGKMFIKCKLIKRLHSKWTENAKEARGVLLLETPEHGTRPKLSVMRHQNGYKLP